LNNQLGGIGLSFPRPFLQLLHMGLILYGNITWGFLVSAIDAYVSYTQTNTHQLKPVSATEGLNYITCDDQARTRQILPVSVRTHHHNKHRLYDISLESTNR
jgi:hypothetical protein